jgi:hypothetical protein
MLENSLFKGTVAWDFGISFFHESTPNRLLMNVKEWFYIFSPNRENIRAQSFTFRVLSEESQIIVLCYTMFFNFFFEI